MMESGGPLVPGWVRVVYSTVRLGQGPLVISAQGRQA